MRSITAAGHGPAKIVARAVIVGLAGLLAAALGTPPGPLPGAAAQEQPAGTAIAFLNPSDYGETRVASSQNMGGHGYHIVATVNEAPSDARVVFEIESDGVGRRRLGIAEQQGANSFALNWRIPPPDDFPAGTYTMRAILFSGNRQVADDETTVNVRHDRPAVKIDTPANGNLMGVYVPPGEEGRWNTIINYTFGAGTEQVAFFYSLTPPGQESEWHDCGTVRVSSSVGEGAPEPESRRHLCELGEGHDGMQVTAVAAVATDIPFPLARNSVTANTPLFGDSSGDAHGVLPYRQLPSSLSLRVQGEEPGTEGPRIYEADSCTNQILVFARDQENRPVAGVNIDVHATGPEGTEDRAGLRFDVGTGGQGTDPNRPPEQNHQDETGAWSCGSRSLILGPGPDGAQGNHRNPTGPDTRHVESAGGTDVNGRFRFRLYNDQPGGTQVTAWADLDGDDLYCALEPAAHMTFGWNQAPPPVEGHAPERDTCPIPGVEQVQEQQITRLARAITLQAGPLRNRGVARGRVRIVQRGRPACRRNVPVRVQRRPLRGGRWNLVRNPSTNRGGVYRTGNRIVRPNGQPRPGRFRAIAPRYTFTAPDGTHVICGRAVSPVRRVPRN